LEKVVAVVAATLLAGCPDNSGARSDGLRDGVYRYELTEQYLLENGIPPDQARRESGIHEITIERGSFIDRWHADDGTAGSCWGAYSEDGTRVAFRWIGGCTGDWAMTYTVHDAVVVWSDFEPLDPNVGAQEQKITKVFNGVPWTRVGDVPEEGES
jgi:hypothetical protein